MKGALEEGTFIAHGTEVLEVRDAAAYKKRFEPFAELYGHIKGSPYPLEYAEQFDVQEFAEENLLFVGLQLVVGDRPSFPVARASTQRR